MTKTQDNKNRLFHRVRKQRLKYITVLPSLITLLNGVCGLAAISFASKAGTNGFTGFYFNKPQLTAFAMAGYMIALAMLCDMLDGRVARMSKNTSSFGGQLDSLCDMISFGVAPAFLMIKVLEVKLLEITNTYQHVGIFLGKFFWIAAAAYMCCGAVRLARYNAENEEDEASHMSFMGLPIPAAAAVIASIVIFYQELATVADRTSLVYQLSENAILCLLPIFTLGTRALMVSRIRYPHVLNQYLKGRIPFAHLIRIGLLLGLIVLNFEAAMVLVACGFALNGFLRWLFSKVLAKKKHTEPLEPRIA